MTTLRPQPVASAYLAIILIWSSTPLAIQLSSDGSGFLLALSARFSIASLILIGYVYLSGQGLPWHRSARQTYLISSISVYGAMVAVYWSAQHIPSGWIAVIFGLSPLITGLAAQVLLRGSSDEKPFAAHKLAAMLLGSTGLGVIFWVELEGYPDAEWGVLGSLLGVFLYSVSAVLIKRHHHKTNHPPISGIQTTAGSLALSTPAMLITWWLSGGLEGLNQQLNGPGIPTHSLLAIAYLGLFGSVLGFSLYYYLLSQIDASQVALITLITPIGGLLIGIQFNQEPLTAHILIGSALVLIALLLYQSPMLKKRFTTKRPAP